MPVEVITLPVDPTVPMSPKQAAWYFQYRDVKSFLAMCRREGIPMERVNARVIRFSRASLDIWRNGRRAA